MSQIHTVTMPANGISRVGVEEIEYFLHNERLPELPHDWRWEFQVGGKGAYVGSFSKRVGKYMHNKNCKLSVKQRARIGELAASHCEKQGRTYHFRFVNTFTWSGGDHDDGDSCFWMCRSAVRPVLEDCPEFGAMLFYEDETATYGIGRSLLWDTGSVTLVWNTYGFGSHGVGSGNLTVARILAFFRDHSYYCKIDMQNRERYQGLIWINCSAYAVGDQESVLELNNEYDMGIECDYACVACDKAIYADKIVVGQDGKKYCLCCWQLQWAKCGDCAEVIDVGDAIGISGYGYYCKDCCSKWFVKCSECKNHIRDIHAKRHDEKPYCIYCFGDLFAMCGCGHVERRTHLHCVGMDSFCDKCYTETFLECNGCGGRTRKSDAVEKDEKYYCVDCSTRQCISQGQV